MFQISNINVEVAAPTLTIEFESMLRLVYFVDTFIVTLVFGPISIQYSTRRKDGWHVAALIIYHSIV